MNPDLVDVTIVLDRSESMKERTFEVLSAFNTLVNSEEFHHYEAVFNLSLFDSRYLPLMELAPIDDLPELLLEDYRPQGGCALLDALGHAIDDIGLRLSETAPEDRPGRIVVITLTAGREDCSHQYTLSEVERRIARQTEDYGWEFRFPIEGIGHLARNVPAWNPLVLPLGRLKAQ